MTDAECKLDKAKRALKRALAAVTAAQQDVWLERRGNGHRCVAEQLAEDMYQCATCGLDMST